MGTWWNSEKKGLPVTVATPIYPGAVPLATPVPNSSSRASAPTQPTDNYYVEAPSGPRPPPNSQHYPKPNGRTHPQTMEGQLRKAMGKRTSLHKLLIMYQLIAGMTGVNNFVAQCWALRYHGNIHMEMILRFYLIGFCALVVVNEIDFLPALRDRSYVLSNWICKGAFYSFLGALAQSLYDVGYDNRYRSNGGYGNYNSNASWGNRQGDQNGYYGPRMWTSEDFAEWYIWLTSYLLFMVGIVYIVMGGMRLQTKLKKLRAEYQQSIGRK